MSATTPHRFTGYVFQTLNERGIRCARGDVDQGLQEISEQQLRTLHQTVTQLAKGNDSPALWAMASAFRKVTASSTREALLRHGMANNAQLLLSLATLAGTSEHFLAALSKLDHPEAVEREKACEHLKSLCGASQPAPPSTAEFELPPLVEDEGPAALPSAYIKPVGGPRMAETALAVATKPEKTNVALAPAKKAQAATDFVARNAKVYGKQGALTWELAPVRDSTSHPSAARVTVMVEGANASPGGKEFNWDNKIVFMCTQRELHQLLAVLMGWVGELQFKFHGQTRQKELHITHQDHGLLVHLREAKNNVRVPVEDADRYALSMLVLAALQLNEPHLDSAAILSVARAMAMPGKTRSA